MLARIDAPACLPGRATPRWTLALVLALTFGAAACGDDATPRADDAVPDAASPDGSASQDTAADGAGEDGTDDDADAPDDAVDPRPDPPILAELRDLGLMAWLEEGPEPTFESSDGASFTWAFDADPATGPLCLRGDAFRFSVRDTGHPNLVVFLQGGGACWSEFCLAVRRAPAGIPGVDALNRALEANPLRDWNVLYLPYCDGSLFAGDRDHDDNGDGTTDRFHRGLHNLTGALRHARTAFPEPERIVLTGSSAGGFGTILAVFLVRGLWPHVPIDVVNDSGVGVARPGDRAWLGTLLDEFNVTRFIPASCEGCLDDGHIAPLIGWALDRDPNLRVAVFSSWYDSIIASTFLQIPDATFRDALRAQTDALHDAHPDRYRRFFVDGITHTAMLGDPTGIIGSDLRAVELPPGFLNNLSSVKIGSLADTRIGDRTFGSWLDDFVHTRDAWTDLLEDPGTPPDEVEAPTEPDER